MKAWVMLGLAGSLIFAWGCGTTFGVKKEVWETLDEKQKEKIIEEYYAEKKREDRIEEKEREAQKAREERLLASLDKDAHFPDKVLYGKLFGGRFRYDDDYYHYKPVHFSIAYGEIKPIPIELTNGKCQDCYIEYADGTFLFDVSIRELDRDRGRSFAIKETAGNGVHFSSFSTSNTSPLDGHGLHLNLRVRSIERERSSREDD